MKKILSISVLTIVFGLFLVVGKVGAVAPRPHRPDVVTTEPASYVFHSEWVTGVSQDGGVKGQSLKMTDFAYYGFQNWWDQKLVDVTKIRASFLAGVGTVNGGGSPRFSLEVENADGSQYCINNAVCDGTNPVAIFLDPVSCGDPAATGGGWVESDFTGDRTNCTITDNIGNPFVSDGTQSAWSKLVASLTYSDKRVWFLFLIQDSTTGSNYVDRIMLDSALFTKAP